MRGSPKEDRALTVEKVDDSREVSLILLLRRDAAFEGGRDNCSCSPDWKEHYAVNRMSKGIGLDQLVLTQKEGALALL